VVAQSLITTIQTDPKILTLFSGQDLPTLLNSKPRMLAERWIPPVNAPVEICRLFCDFYLGLLFVREQIMLA